MRERWMVDRVRDRLIETTARMQRLRDELRFGMLRPDQADKACAVILAQLENARALAEEASASLRATGPTGSTQAQPASRTEHRRERRAN
jgi:hypothetical protein